MQQTTIQITKETQERLKEAGTMNDTYDTLLNRLIQEHEILMRIDFFVEMQHEIAKNGRFVELG
ncbi:MAG TPA: hypothetical protein VJB06_02930 [archaeon]|nr:hypothetical protein [archaeon]